MENKKQVIKNIIISEFSGLIKNIEEDFAINYHKKNNNFLLSQFDQNIIANMVFVSSFESKCGNVIESCIRRIAKLKFGDENVPKIINPLGLKHNINESTVKGQMIISDVDFTNGNLKGKISAFRANRVAAGRGNSYVKSGVNQESIKELIDVAKEYKTEKIHTKPVDLAFFDGTNWILMELKAGGDLDSSNAPSNVEKLLTLYAGLQVKNSKLYFATIYNKNGEGNTWTGIAKKHLAFPEMFLIGKDFWNTILPNNIKFEEFTQIYTSALEEINFNEHMNNMIRDVIK